MTAPYDDFEIVIESDGIEVVVDPDDVPDELIVVEVGGPPGPPGPQGPPGSGGGDGIDWWSGHGPPGTIVGSSPGDKYVDEDTGTIYTLGD